MTDINYCEFGAYLPSVILLSTATDKLHFHFAIGVIQVRMELWCFLNTDTSGTHAEKQHTYEYSSTRIK